MGGRGLRRLVLLTAATVLAIGTTGCKPEVAKELLFVNDSITAQSVEHLVNEFNAVAVDSEELRYAPNFGSSVGGIGLRQVPGIPADEVDAYWVAHLTSVLEHVDPEVIIVELGYNDCGYDLADYGTDVDDFMALVPTATPVHWLTVADANDSTTCDETINDVLEEATDRWPNLTLLDFGAHMAGHPEWTEDGRHLNDAGRSEYATWLHAELDARYTESEPPPEPPPEPAPEPN